MRFSRFILILAPLAAGTASADILHLRDGTRYYGQVLRQDASACEFRIYYAEDVSAVRTFPAELIARVERSARIHPPADEKLVTEKRREPDYEQMLREAFELADDGDLAAALAALRRVVRAGPETLATLDHRTRGTHGTPLDKWMAGLRMQLALTSDPPSLRLLRDPTPFEARALADRLQSLENELLSRRFGPRDLFAWARNHAAYQALQPDARSLVDAARLAAGLLSMRLRFDPALREDRAARAMIVSLRGDLVRLGAHVRSLPGYTGLGYQADDNDPTTEVARRLAEEAEKAAATLDPGEETLDEMAEAAASRPAPPESETEP